MKNIYVKDRDRCFTPVYVPGENYSFYLNFQNPTNDADFDDFVLRIYKGNAMVANNVGVLKKQFVKDIFYNIWCDFIFPVLGNGEFQFVIYDSVKNVEKARSNYILVENTQHDLITQRIEYSNELNGNKFYYESLPGFTNKFRLPLSKIDVQFPSEKKQYRNITNNKLRTFQTFRDKVVKIESYYFDEDAHEAMSAVVDCNNVIIGGSKYVPKTGYNINNNISSLISKGDFEAYEDTSEIVQSAPIGTLVLNQNQLQVIGKQIALEGLASLDKGVVSTYDFYANNVQRPAQPQVLPLHDYGNWIVLSGLQEFKVIMNYTLGVKTGLITATSDIEGVYAIFATITSITVATDIPLVSMLTGNNIEITLKEESGANKQFIEIPLDWLTARPLLAIQYYVNHLGRFEALNKISDFSTFNVTKVIEGNNVTYKRYTYNGIQRGSILIKLIF